MLQCQNVQVTENSFFSPFGQTIEVVVRCGFSLEGYDWLLVYTVLMNYDYATCDGSDDSIASV